ncbi:C40 family peptidase [Paenibacillus oleatilyticus]|uniref:C40 family peptidase n=1 Tax=Paenibacillus oleatilyticus TaxID=2594886 RepID=UPI001C1FD5FE|nr:C40 family peptidase [Paenibacillus oleatilyticus]MBU7320824.1 C40 family peptidase [Paenibacillus oleatilyticus]
MIGSWRRPVAASLVACLLAAGCGPQLSKEQRLSNQQGIPSNHGQAANRLKSEEINGKTTTIGLNGGFIRMLTQGRVEMTIPTVTIGGTSYVVGSDFAKIVGFRFNWDQTRGVFQLGEHDASYELKPGQTSALRDDETVALKEAPVLFNSQIHIPVSALNPVFAKDFSFEIKEQAAVVQATDWAVSGAIDGPLEASTGAELDFGDDPKDPFPTAGGTSTMRLGRDPLLEASDAVEAMKGLDGFFGKDDMAVPVLRQVDMNALLTRAQRYVGVNYSFGAAPYSTSGKFDCSTFTQYVFAKSGITLNRTARAQAKQGTAINRKQLRKGDLLFFYVPGKFRSQKTVGHVGIYLGNQRMIHSAPEPKDGVQITHINNAYWKQTFLAAKRVSS